MVHSPAGVVMESWWFSIPRQFPHVKLDAVIVMPNHLHGIVTIEPQPPAEGAHSPKLSDIIHWFKIWTSNDYGIGVRDDGWPRYPGRLWQHRYYEHIIRNDAALEKIRAYIEENPSQWPTDEHHPSADDPVDPARSLH